MIKIVSRSKCYFGGRAEFYELERAQIMHICIDAHVNQIITFSNCEDTFINLFV